MKLRILLVILIFTPAIAAENFDEIKCETHLEYFHNSLEIRENWAIQLFDFWAKFQSGILMGNNNNPGHFTKCVEFRHNSSNSSIGVIQGQHCMVKMTAGDNVNHYRTTDKKFDWGETGEFFRDKNIILSHGICLPSSCSNERVLKYINGILRAANLKATDANCRTNDPIEFKALDIFAIVIFAVFTVLLLASTAYDVMMLKNKNEPEKLLIAFSLYTNGANLFDISEVKLPNAINCLNGIRALSIFWIIFGHRYDERFFVPAMNSDDVFNFPEKFISLIHSLFTIAVDTFLLMGGLLMTLSFLNALDKKTVNIPRMYFHRYLRYTPVLAMLILFFVTFPKFLGTGPFFNIESYTLQCKKYWWTALLHVQNYVNPNELCLDWSWYLSVDFQMFIISPILIYPLWKYGWKFFWLLPALVLMTQACIFVSSYQNEILVFVGRMIFLRGKEDWERLIYFPTHTRMGPWIIGIMLGFIMYENRKKHFKISKIWNTILWILSMSMMLTIIFCYYPFQKSEQNNTTTLFGNALYNSCFRIGWSYAVAWIIFACQNGTGGIIRWFLSLRQWQPIARMGLSMYMVHRMYQIITIISKKQPIYFEFFPQLHNFFGDIFVTIILGSIIYLTFEVPFFIIENHFYKKMKSK